MKIAALFLSIWLLVSGCAQVGAGPQSAVFPQVSDSPLPAGETAAVLLFIK